MPTPSKKLYEAVALVIAIEGRHSDWLHKDGVIRRLSLVFKADNQRFNADKFREACLTDKHIRKSIREGR